MKEEFVEEVVTDTLLFLAKKIKNRGCTREQEKAIADLLSTGKETYATIDEIAEFYGKSREAVYGVIKRKYIGKPKRNIVMYSLTQFAQIAPKSWRVGSGGTES